MAENDGSKKLSESQADRSPASSIRSQEQLPHPCLNHQLLNAQFEVSFGKFLEDMDMAINIFKLKTRMRRARMKRQKSKSADEIDLESEDSIHEDIEVRMKIEPPPCLRPRYDLFHTERRELTPYKDEEMDIGAATLSRVRMLRVVLQNELGSRQDHVTTRADFAPSIFSQLRQQTFRSNEDCGAGDYENHSEESQSSEGIFVNHFQMPSSENIVPSPVVDVPPSVGISPSVPSVPPSLADIPPSAIGVLPPTLGLINTAGIFNADIGSNPFNEISNRINIEQDVSRIFNNEFNKFNNVIRPSKCTASMQNDYKLFDDYLQSLSNELEDYLNWVKTTMENRKPLLQIDIQVEMLAEQTNSKTKNDTSSSEEYDEDLELTIIVNDLNQLALLGESYTEVQPIQEGAAKEEIPNATKEDIPKKDKKKRIRCAQCNKKLHITNIYKCRCGKVYCSQHRYSECHDCTYDYKAEGRKIIEEENPVITNPKITKF